MKNILKFFRKPVSNNVIVAEKKAEPKVEPKVDLKVKKMNEMIEEIHESFYTEVDKLLASAKVSKSIESQKESLIEKRNKLFALGFTNTKEVQEANVAIENLKKSESIIKAINYFSQKYPLYKFITEESVIKICEKYNLVYGDASKYIGKVPDKNLQEMQNFKVEVKDVCFTERWTFSFSSSTKPVSFYDFESAVLQNLRGSRWIKGVSKDNAIEYQKAIRELVEEKVKQGNVHLSHSIISKSNLEIAAPLKDFDMKDSEIKNFKISKIEIPDPVVMQPVFFEGQKHFLIVTAWGIEAGDELVVNSINN